MEIKLSAGTMAMSKKDWAQLHSKALTIVREDWDGWTGGVSAVVFSSAGDDDEADARIEMAMAREFAAAPVVIEAAQAVIDCWDVGRLDLATMGRLIEELRDAVERARG
jgi:hypothetical protein